MPNAIRCRRICGRRASGGFTPANLSNLAFWVRSDMGITLSGEKVSKWNDLSGNARNLIQSTDSKQPTFQSNQLNGQPVVTFDGITQYMQTAAFTLNQPETIWCVLKAITWRQSATFFDGGGLNRGRVFQNNSTPSIRSFSGDVCNNNSDMVIGTYCLLMAVFNDGASELVVNNIPNTTGGNATLNMGGFTLGETGSPGSSEAGNISVAEVAIQSSIATSAERTSMQTYVTNRYGITM